MNYFTRAISYDGLQPMNCFEYLKLNFFSTLFFTYLFVIGHRLQCLLRMFIIYIQCNTTRPECSAISPSFFRNHVSSKLYYSAYQQHPSHVLIKQNEPYNFHLIVMLFKLASVKEVCQFFR